ncbi:MAG: hypothetical protein HZT41_16005 [Dechloromonas sp.]|nr:MAG: hypothetical protein HZT41_16005 [Dechloromonas sp.]
MTPSPNLHSPMRQRSNPPAANAFHCSDENLGSFDLRATLPAMTVRELSFAEFRAAIENCGKRLS